MISLTSTHEEMHLEAAVFAVRWDSASSGPIMSLSTVFMCSLRIGHRAASEHFAELRRRQ
jgi:hypothetical protein